MTRACKICGLTKALVQSTWVFKRGKPEGNKCLKCTAALRKAKLDADPEARRLALQRTKDWCLSNRDRCIELSKAWYYSKENHDRTLAHRRVWYSKNTEVAKERNAAWRAANIACKNAHSRRYMLLKLKACPKWLSKSDIKAMEEFYIKARELSETTGILHHVDHIVPIQGKRVSGLHVPWNLQILTASENSAKSNKLPGDLNE